MEGAKALSQNTILTSLNISNNRIGDEGAIALSQNTTLTSLDISRNLIGVKGAKALSQNTSLTSLKISANTIGNEGAKALSMNATLTTLGIDENRVSAEGAKALSRNITLTSLDIGWNQVGAEGAKALSQNTSLTSLVIYDNRIGDEGAKALSQNTTLTWLNITGNQISNEAKQLITQMLERNNKHLENRNRFIRTLHKELLKLNVLTMTKALPLPPELIHHIGLFLDANFYLQLTAIKHPTHMGKTTKQVYHCALFLLYQFAIGKLTDGNVIERKPKGKEVLSYNKHFLFKSDVNTFDVNTFEVNDLSLSVSNERCELNMKRINEKLSCSIQ